MYNRTVEMYDRNVTSMSKARYENTFLVFICQLMNLQMLPGSLSNKEEHQNWLVPHMLSGRANGRLASKRDTQG